jgi:SAM-dependent methyltransferase
MDFYRTDLAYIHDIGLGDFAAQAAPGLLKLLRRNKINSGLVVDLACGSGIWAKALSRAGYDVLGVDMSAAMIALARRKAPEARFMKRSFLSAKLPQCEAVTALGECFNYEFDPRTSRQNLARLFQRIHSALRPGGVLVFDVAMPGRLGSKGPVKKWFVGRDWALLLESREDTRRALLSRRIIIFRKVGRHYRRSEETHHLRLYEPLHIAQQLGQMGFEVNLLRGYGRFKFAPGLVGFVARKKK